MASSSRKEILEDGEWVVKPSATYCFVDGVLVRPLTSNRGMNITYFINTETGERQAMLYTDFQRRKKNAYSLEAAGKILGRTPTAIKSYIRRGGVKPPVTVGNQPRGIRVLSYYSEDDIMAIHRYMATLPAGRPRKDGLVTPPRMLTEAEVRARMGQGLFMYTKTRDGRFIPTWKEYVY